MTKEQKEHINSLKFRINDEGMDYCFNNYSDWVEIKDKKFHELRLKYIQIGKELKEYVKNM